jgi:hypothetical protein
MTHSSAAEGTRNLVDSSLPKTLKTMFEHAERLDTRNYALGEFPAWHPVLTNSNQCHGDFCAQRADILDDTARIAAATNLVRNPGKEISHIL